jgi:hypothetical protein
VTNLVEEKQSHYIEMIISKDEFILNEIGEKVPFFG